MKILDNATITTVPFFKASGVHCGLRKKNKKDLCVIYSEKKAIAAAVFTRNNVKAAPIYVNMEHINNKNTQAIVISSAYANTCTGAKGIENAFEMTEALAKALNLKPQEVLVSSTGRIGIQLPMDKVLYGIELGVNELSYDGGEDASDAILTTDTFTKTFGVEFEIDEKKVKLCAIAKGSGMVHPNMGTILSFMSTDLNISKEMLTKALRDSTEISYNMISVDGDTSTNDMAVIFANGVAGNKLIDSEDENYLKFKEALDFLNIQLSKMIAKDGEGATKLIEVDVLNAKTLDDARRSAKAVINSSLVKSAFFGSDANWGRIMCSLGYSGAEINPYNIDIHFKNSYGEAEIVKAGIDAIVSAEVVENILKQEHINIVIDLKDGEYNATAWGCDLTYDYVRINGYYRT